MTDIHAFNPFVVTAADAPEVVSPAYDSMSSDERLRFRQAHPRNYINVMRTTDDFPEGHRPSESQVTAENIDQLNQLRESGAFSESSDDALFIYRLEIDGHQQTGIVTEIPISEYGDGSVRKHEETRKEHELRLVSYLKEVGASSSPVCLAYDGRPGIDAIVDDVARSVPFLDFSLPDGIHQKLWRVTDKKQIEILKAEFREVHATYLTDGHHRAASTLRHAAARHAEGYGVGPWDFLLVVLFPAEQLRVLPFNRCVRDMGPLSLGEFLEEISEHFSVEPVPATEESLPTKHGQFLMIVGDQAFRLTRHSDLTSGSPVENLDVSYLQDRLLSPILGIQDARGDSRLDYVTGDSGLAGLKQRQAQGWQLGFACFPTSMEELMAVADAGEVMPPKSTCFDPKPRSGLFLRIS